MCLGLPGRLVSWRNGERMARVEIAGVVREIDVSLIRGPLAPDDHVLVHSGVALERIAPDRAAEMFRLLAGE
jgi:hydrogenase expression/formation protein HypC